MSAETILDWRLAERVGVAVAGGSSAGTGDGRPFGPAAVVAACAEAAPDVVAYTGLGRPDELPAGEAVDRAGWVRGALRSLREAAGPLEARLAEGISLPGRLGSVARAVAGAAGGAEAGAAVGIAGRRVLGQLDVSLGARPRPPRLLLVEPNLVDAHREIGGAEGEFLAWIATHEVTHAVQFVAVEWLREHLRSELEAILDAAAGGIDAAELRALARRLVTTDPRRTIRALLQGELARALAGPEQARRLDRLQATMAVVEGYAEHVMDVAAPPRVAERQRLRDRLERRRSSRSGLSDAVARLLGIELKLRQYRVGKAFCDAVVAASGIEGLNRVWTGPDLLPGPDELEAPERWLERTAPVAA